MLFLYRKKCIFAASKKGVSVAQQVEHIPFKDGVLGSSPSWNTKSPDQKIRTFFNLFISSQSIVKFRIFAF